VFNDAPTSNAPQLATDAGNGFLMNQGYSIVWVGWQGDVPVGNNRLTATFPVAKNADGSTIIGLSREEYVDTGTEATFLASLTYPAAVQSGTLTVREKESDPRQTPSDLTMTWLTEKQININRPAGFDSGAIYELIYQAKDPIVMGIGFAAIKDAISFLRYEVADDKGNVNPLAFKGHPFMKYALGFGISQSGRYLRDFLYQGFNEDERHRRVFDGINPHIAGSRKTFTNYAFAQPSRFSRQHEDHLFPGDQFPFSYASTYDPISHRRDGILSRCSRTNSCPKIIQTDSESELWQARASLVVINTTGKPVSIPPNVRVFLFMGTQHVPAATSVPGICQSPSNTLPYSAELRALNMDLADWVRKGAKPPESRYPTIQQGELVPVRTIKFPEIPGTHFNFLDNELPLKVRTDNPPKTGLLYPIFQAVVDADGNGIGGVRHPFLSVPTATHSAWNIRSMGNAIGVLGNSPPKTVEGAPVSGTAPAGLEIPFARTRNERMTTSDPRLSLEERYQTHDQYVRKVTSAAKRLQLSRLLLEPDAKAIVEQAQKANVP
jgi:Alpha/beta hydrolase domain